jgi:large subunit ribosomal protein L15
VSGWYAASEHDMKLEELKPADGAVKNRRRVGRGLGSGRGRTASRGTKGQGSRSGYSQRAGFEGGQMPLQRRMPKRGFTNVFRREMACVNVGEIARVFGKGSSVTPEALAEKGLVKGARAGVKVLGDGDVAHALAVKAHAFSATAREKLEKAGGSAEVIAG